MLTPFNNRNTVQRPTFITRLCESLATFETKLAFYQDNPILTAIDHA